MTLRPARRLDPPHDVAQIGDQGMNTAAWAEHHQNVADRLAQIGVGVTDGSDAAAGQIGEFISAAGATIGLASGVVATTVSLSLPAGDWDVSGNVRFSAGPGTQSYFGAGINGIDTVIAANFAAGTFQEAITPMMRRVNVSAPTTVALNAQASFSGAMTATGFIQARRAR